MIVTRSNFEAALTQLSEECEREKFVAFDTETTALFWWKSPHYAFEPRVFSMQFSTEKSDYYFDFGAKESVDPLGNEHYAAFQNLFARTDLTWFIHNAKFDMHHCYNHGLLFSGTMHCTQAIARVVNNLEDEKKVSLDSLSEKYLGANKIDLSQYWDETRVTKIKRPGENGRYYDFLHFDRLPLNVLVEYGERDTRLCYRLGMMQLASIKEQNEKYFENNPSNFNGNLKKVYANECELVKTLFWVERRGVLIDMPFVKEAYAHSIAGIKAALTEIDPVAKPYVDEWNSQPDLTEKEKLDNMDWNSGPHMERLFKKLGIPYAFTEKGTASFDKECLEKSDHPIAAKILEYRRHSKRAFTYFENYMWLADTDNVIHPSFAQGGPQTGRMSCRDPNLQNVPKRADKKEADFVIRRCFIPRPGKILVSADYDQVEYRMMLDYARAAALISRILVDGLNVHEATDQALGLGDYDRAKTMNFMILYGGGVPKVASALYANEITASKEELQAIYMLHRWPTWRRQKKLKDGTVVSEFDRDKKLRADVAARGELVQNLNALKKAEAQLDRYFDVLPEVKEFIKKVKDKAKETGAINTWLGRILQYGPSDMGHTNYKAPNGLIQGGAGDLSKVAANACHAYLRDHVEGSYLILHVHDELLFEVDITETRIVPQLIAIMQSCFPHRLIPLTAGAAWSEKSWGELKDGLPLEA